MNISRRLFIIISGLGLIRTTGATAQRDATYPGAGIAMTPEQTAGPFYPAKLPRDHDADLAAFGDAVGSAEGEIVHVEGSVFDHAGQPLTDAVVDLWQCDSHGIYHHPRDRAEGRDKGFQGFGRTPVDEAGRYRFRTIRPVAYAGRTPHLHFRVWQGEQLLLTTQCYDADQRQANATDGIYHRLSAEERDAVTVQFKTDADFGVAVGQFDMRIA